MFASAPAGELLTQRWIERNDARAKHSLEGDFVRRDLGHAGHAIAAEAHAGPPQLMPQGALEGGSAGLVARLTDPAERARLAREDACVDHGNGEGTLAAMFLTAIESAASAPR